MGEISRLFFFYLSSHHYPETGSGSTPSIQKKRSTILYNGRHEIEKKKFSPRKKLFFFRTAVQHETFSHCAPEFGRELSMTSGAVRGVRERENRYSQL